MLHIVTMVSLTVTREPTRYSSLLFLFCFPYYILSNISLDIFLYVGLLLLLLLSCYRYMSHEIPNERWKARRKITDVTQIIIIINYNATVVFPEFARKSKDSFAANLQIKLCKFYHWRSVHFYTKNLNLLSY